MFFFGRKDSTKLLNQTHADKNGGDCSIDENEKERPSNDAQCRKSRRLCRAGKIFFGIDGDTDKVAERQKRHIRT
jgi:hypothetical protein